LANEYGKLICNDLFKKDILKWISSIFETS
jgi:hypothetical protein